MSWCNDPMTISSDDLAEFCVLALRAAGVSGDSVAIEIEKNESLTNPVVDEPA